VYFANVFLSINLGRERIMPRNVPSLTVNPCIITDAAESFGPRYGILFRFQGTAEE
tara:strand:+ start:965 stop:1132 length:168 start_codon:yes stop_codon:yes gene_type:complete